VRHWKAMIGIALLFALGFLSGMLVTTWRLRPVLRREPPPDRALAFLVRELPRELDLDETQRAQVQKAVREARRDLRVVQREFRPRVDEILGRAHDSILPLLTDEQRDKLEKLRQRRSPRRPRRRLEERNR
jgi:hypothetical protein